MKKVVFLVPSLGMGGMERVQVNYANLFVKRGYDVTVLNFSYDDACITEGFDKRIHYIRNYIPVNHLIHTTFKEIIRLKFRILPWKYWIMFHSSNYLHRKYINEHYDVEIAFFGSEAIKIISGCSGSDVCTIGWIHNVNVEDDIKPLGNIRLAKRVYSAIQKLVCVSTKSKEKIEEVFDRSKNVYVVNNPNNTKLIRSKSQEKISLNKRKFTFITVARFDDHQKGFLRLFDVCKRLLDEEYDFDLWLIGEGDDFEKIRKKAEELKLINVFLLGKKENPYPYIKEADMYLCASYFEGFSMVMMEAIILGTPMLTTDVSGANEMLDSGKYGMIVDNSSEGIYEGIKNILCNKDLFYHYCKMADLRKDYLSEEKIMDEVERIIDNDN